MRSVSPRVAADTCHCSQPAAAHDGLSPVPVGQAIEPVGDPLSHDMPEADWDMLFQAVAARLRLTVDAASAAQGTGHIGADVLECVQALEQLHAELAHERSHRLRIEDELQQSHDELAQARRELTGARDDEQHARHLALHDSLMASPQQGTLKLGVYPGIALSPTDGFASDRLLDGADAARVRARRDPLGYAFFDIRDDA